MSSSHTFAYNSAAANAVTDYTMTENGLNQVATISVPAEHVLLKEIPYSATERKLLAKTLPWTLEDQLVDDVENLHVAIAILSDDLAIAAVVRKAWLEQTLENLNDQHIQTASLVPEALLLPWQNGRWVAQFNPQNGRFVWRIGVGNGFACHENDLALVLSLALTEQQPPESILVYTDLKAESEPNTETDKETSTKIKARIYSALQKIRFENDTKTLADNLHIESNENFNAETSAIINLLQGEYAPRIAWDKIWKKWQKTLGIVAVLTIAQLLVVFADLEIAKSEDKKLRYAIEKSYREAIPVGNMIEPVRQLKRKLSSYNTTNSSYFTSLLNDVGSELTKNKGLQLQGLTYSEQKNSLQLTLLADNFNSVESLRNSFEDKGLEAKLSSSNAEGEKVRARLQINGKAP